MEKREFNRHVTDDLIEGLKKQPLWQEKLKGDCEAGNVFLAIRKDRIGFYHKGGRLFEFDGQSFSTHVKYSLVINTEDETAPENYVYEAQLANIPMISNFIDGYGGMKKNCELYSGDEARGVSNLYQKNSYLHSDSVFVLDIEIAFKNDDKKQERIDVLLYDNNSQTLRFVEAKQFSNSDLHSTSTPQVVEQIKNYEERIGHHKEKLIEEYGLYVDGLNQIFGKQLSRPKTIEPEVSLLIFGFDEAQEKDDRFQKMRLAIQAQKIPMYRIGDPKGLKAESVWRGN